MTKLKEMVKAMIEDAQQCNRRFRDLGKGEALKEKRTPAQALTDYAATQPEGFTIAMYAHDFQISESGARKRINRLQQDAGLVRKMIDQTFWFFPKQGD